MALLTSSAYSIKFESVLVESERLPVSYEIVRNVAEINIFENIDLPFLTGSILVSDSSNLLNLIGFQGTEKITITVKIDGDERSKSTTKRFVVTDIGGVAPVNDHAEALILNIIEDIGYQSRLITVSKAYSGKPEDIIKNILMDNLRKEVDTPYDFENTVVRPLKVIIPAMTPLDAVRWVKNRMVSPKGMPYFLYSTFNNDKLMMSDLGYLLEREPMNETRHYTFGQAFTRFTTGEVIDEQARVIESYRLVKSENMYKLAKMGTLNSVYYFVDTTKEKDQRVTTTKVSMEDVIANMKSNGLLAKDQDKPIYDNEFTIGDKTIAEYNPSLITQIVSSNTFENYANYYEEENLDLQRMKMEGRALRYYLLKSPIDIMMPGFDFLGRGKDITIGRQITLRFLKNDPNVAENTSEALDTKRSGDYIIYSLRHIMRPEKYSVSMTCAKLGNRK